jgi:hypothetical protein
MSLTNLKDDLLQEFREERKMINAQVEALDPLATSLRKPAAQRIISNGGLIALEILCYLLALGGIVFMVFMNKIYPFYILADLSYNPQYRNIGFVNVFYLQAAIYGMVAFICILFYILGLSLRRIRQKNNILQMAGNNIKTVVGQILTRKAAIETIEQRHFIDLPELQLNVGSSIEIPRQPKQNVNQVMNPGYSEEKNS